MVKRTGSGTMLGTNSLERYLLDTNYVRITPVTLVLATLISHLDYFESFGTGLPASPLAPSPWEWPLYVTAGSVLGSNSFCTSHLTGNKGHTSRRFPTLALWCDLISLPIFLLSHFFQAICTLLLFLEHSKHTPMQRHLPFLTFSARGALSHICYLCSPFTHRAAVSA